MIKANKHNKTTVTYYLLKTRSLDRIRDLQARFQIRAQDKILIDNEDKSTDSVTGDDLKELNESFSFNKSSFYKYKIESRQEERRVGKE